MPHRLALERQRLIREATREADVSRRSWTALFSLAVANVGFACAPLLPHASHLFGALTTSRALLYIAPGMAIQVVAAWVYRRFGGESRAYRLAEAVDAFVLNANVLAFIWSSELARSVLWVLIPFDAMFWGRTKPFGSRSHALILLASNLGVSLALAVRGSYEAAALGGVASVGAQLAYLAVARAGQRNLGLEAERNVAEQRLNATLLDRERGRLTQELNEGVGREIAALAAELDSGLAEQARVALAELGDAVHSDRAPALRSLEELGTRVDQKCRPLCEGIAYEVATTSGPTPVKPDVAQAMLRVAQELVRNAVTHGRARVVRIRLWGEADVIGLSVRDDGVGLSADALARSTGGLENARTWLREQQGTLELVPPQGAGTELRAVIGRQRDHGAALLRAEG